MKEQSYHRKQVGASDRQNSVVVEEATRGCTAALCHTLLPSTYNSPITTAYNVHVETEHKFQLENVRQLSCLVEGDNILDLDCKRPVRLLASERLKTIGE